MKTHRDRGSKVALEANAEMVKLRQTISIAYRTR